MELGPSQILNYSGFENLEFLSKKLVEGFITGLHKSPFHGFSVEFAEHRSYNPGESTRHIDWKVFNKTEKLFTKRYEEETNLRCQLIIDASSSMYYPTETNGKIKFSALAAACIATLLQKQKDAVGLATFASQIEVFTPIKSTPSHLHKIIKELSLVTDNKQIEKKTDLVTILHQLAQKIHRRSLIVIFSDLLDSNTDSNALFSALQHLKHQQNEVLIFHVLDQATELLFEFENRPYEFIDNETKQIIKLNPHQIKEAFIKKSSTFFQEIKDKCSQYKIEFIEADISKGVTPILQNYLNKRAKVK